MTISEYYAVPYKIMTDSVAGSYDFFGFERLEQVNIIMKNSYGARELFISDTGAVLQTKVQEQVKNLFDTHKYSWETLYNSVTQQYYPFERFSITETDTEVNGGTDSKTRTASGTTNLTVTPTTASTTSRRTYNNDSMTEEEKTANSGNETNVGNNSANETFSDIHGHTITKNHSTVGKNNLDYESILKSEREIALFNFVEHIAKIVVDNICLQCYNFDNSYSPSLAL